MRVSLHRDPIDVTPPGALYAEYRPGRRYGRVNGVKVPWWVVRLVRHWRLWRARS